MTHKMRPPNPMYAHLGDWQMPLWYTVESPGTNLTPEAVEGDPDYGKGPYRFSRMFRAQEWMDTLHITDYRIFHHAFGERTLVCAAGHCVNP
jgi:hypothetical protein